ncbi:MAG TPA: hypothetical protein VNK94_10550, partial [Gaiellaceae bacterium]|nr:hypothetical protein [Gaiellaceae bacterium]
MEVQVLSSALQAPAAVRGARAAVGSVLLGTAALLLAVLAGGAAGASAPAATAESSRVQVVVTLASPPLALAPGTAARITAEQRAFRRALARAVPDARVRWRYRL